MANREHLKLLKQGVKAWNKWRIDHPRVRPNLAGADLKDWKLRGINMQDVNLRRANLMGSNLARGNLARASLDYTSFAGANLSYAILGTFELNATDFGGANLSEANFSGGVLIGVNFSAAKLFGTCFEKTIFAGVDLADNDLGQTIGLETIVHGGPSTVGIDTIYKSRGKIPEIFLRNCGVPESFITQMQSLVGAEDGIQFYSCFISYSFADEEFARRLHGRMRDANLRVWFAPEDVQGGKKLHEQIETAIRMYDKLLIVLSEASLQSEWVMTELRKARKAERQTGKRKLFPVRLVDFETLRDWECFDADSGKDLAVELREYFIPDFSNWKDHDSFETAFARLLNDLRAETKTAQP